MNPLLLFVGAFVASRFLKIRAANVLTRALRISIPILCFVFLLLCFKYLRYPGYLDHVEATIADLGLIFREGGQVYPALTEYSLHGLLYGPGLTELQAAAQWLPFSIVVASKLPGIIPALLLVVLFVATTKNTLAKAYVFYFFIFAEASFWNRADPLLALAGCLSIIAVRYPKHVLTPMVLGVLAGASASLKLHGLLYILPSLLIYLQTDPRKIRSGALFCVIAAATFLLAFLPSQVTLANFFSYIELASKHALVPYMVFNNLCYLLVLSLPVLLAVAFRRRFIDPRSLMLILVIEVIVALIGAKTGAGTHHLLPFLFVNAYLFDQALFLDPQEKTGDMAIRLYFALGVIAVIAAFAKVNRAMDRTFDDMSGAAIELSELAGKYPKLRLGVTDRDNYQLSFLRPLLQSGSARQVEFPAFMDLAYAGVSDQTLAQMMASCAFPFWAVPIVGTPFSLPNFYTGKPLLSDAFRSAFAANYLEVAVSAHYRVFKCQAK